MSRRLILQQARGQRSLSPPTAWELSTVSRSISLPTGGCSHFARRYYGNRFCFLFLWLLRCFSSPGCLLPAHGFSRQFKRLTYLGISGSMLIFNSPKLFVAYYALPRLWVPRYPPQAFPLLNLAINVKAMPS
uniref:Uncharacterized protein n=1 Tax=Brassica campestris TaxID=3711 RepID=M4FJ75_BRACM